MKISDFAKAETNVVLGYFVKEEHTLGYLFKNTTGSLNYGVLAGSVIRGGHDWKNGAIYVTSLNNFRKATQKDFNQYRVCSKNHIS